MGKKGSAEETIRNIKQRTKSALCWRVYVAKRQFLNMLSAKA